MPDYSPQKSRLRRGLWRWLWRSVLGLLALGVLAAVLFYLFAVRPDRRSAPYRQALEQLRANESAARLLGAPVEAGWWVRGRAGADSAHLAVPVQGSARAGVLHVEAVRAGSAWVFSRLELTVPDNNLRVSLLDERPQREGQRRAPLNVPPRYRE